MSNTNYITNILNLKDKNIFFKENFELLSTKKR